MGKTKATKPLRGQKEGIAAAGKNPKDFLVLEEHDTYFDLVRRSDGSRYTLKKKPKEEPAKGRKVKKNVQGTIDNKNSRGKLPRTRR